MKKPTNSSLSARACRQMILTVMFVLAMAAAFSQDISTRVEKMPVDLETDLALSSMPPHLRDKATVYLLDPAKGYYVGRQGTNEFICFIVRTEWEKSEFRNDLASPISYDAAGAKAIFPSYADVEEMRASGKYTAAQVHDIMNERYKNGYYKAPSRPGVSYMLAPLMRTYDDKTSEVMTFNFPHYMFYAPNMTNADVGGNPDSGGLIVIGNGVNPHNYMIIPAGITERAKILEEHKDLLKRLEAYKSYYRVGLKGEHH